LENQLKNFWKLNKRMLIKYHTGDSAEMGAYFGGLVLGTSTLTAISLSLSIRRKYFPQIITIT